MTPAPSFDQGFYRGPHDRILPRNQREAGIDLCEWERRIQPRLSWVDIGKRVFMIGMGGFAFLAGLQRAADLMGWLP